MISLVRVVGVVGRVIIVSTSATWQIVLSTLVLLHGMILTVRRLKSESSNVTKQIPPRSTVMAGTDFLPPGSCSASTRSVIGMATRLCILLTLRQDRPFFRLLTMNGMAEIVQQKAKASTDDLNKGTYLLPRPSHISPAAREKKSPNVQSRQLNH